MLNTKLPKTRYKKAAGVSPNYPNLEDRADGASIPIAYGDLHDVVPVCIEVLAQTYKNAGHAIQAIDQVRIEAEILDPLATPPDYTVNLAQGELSIPSTPFLSAGVTYYFVLEVDYIVDPVNHLDVLGFNNVYATGNFFSIADTGIWTSWPTLDLRFLISGYRTFPGPVITIDNRQENITPPPAWTNVNLRGETWNDRIAQSFTPTEDFYCTGICVWFYKGYMWNLGYNIRVSILSTVPVPLSDPPLPAEVQVGASSAWYALKNSWGAHMKFPFRTESANLLCDIEGAKITGTTIHRAVSGNVATIGTAAAHGLIVGSSVVISGMTDATYNGTFTVTVVPDTTHFKYALTHGDEGETADTGGTWVGAIVIGADMLEDLVVNRLGKSSTILESTALANLKTKRRQEIAAYIDCDNMTFGDIVGKLESSLLFKFVPLHDGTYAPIVYEADVAEVRPHFFDEHFLSFSMRHDFAAVKSIIKVKYDENPSNDEFKVAEADSDVAKFVYGVEETLEVETYLKQEAAAATLALDYLGMYETPPLEITFEIRGYGLDLIPGRDKVRITRTRAAYAGGALNDVLFRIMKITKRPATASTEIVAVLDTQTY